MRAELKSMSTVLKSVLLASVLLGVVSCGGSTNNDQGVSFTLLGFYPNDTEAPGCGSLPSVGLAGLSMPLTDRGSEGGSGADFGQAVLAVMALQNAQTGVALLTEQARMNFSIPGSSLAIPSSAVAINLVLGPAEERESSSGTGDEEGGFEVDRPNSTLPDSFREICNVGYTSFDLVPSDVREFLNFNRNSLPELPFIMNVTVTATAVSTAGKFLETNTRTIAVEVVSDIGI